MMKLIMVLGTVWFAGAFLFFLALGLAASRRMPQLVAEGQSVGVRGEDKHLVEAA